jgi:hypothetical protein
MPRRAIFVALAILLAALVVFAQKKASNNQQTNGPRLAMASFEHSFGTVKPGTPLNHTFKVKNTGKARLEITSVSPSCGCTTSNYDKVIEAGQTGGISLAIEKTESYRGEIVKTAEVTTNDPAHPRFTLTLRANFSEK